MEYACMARLKYHLDVDAIRGKGTPQTQLTHTPRIDETIGHRRRQRNELRKQYWTGFWPISNREGLTIGLRLAFGRPEADFEIFSI
jgi:hypothetical protein